MTENSQRPWRRISRVLPFLTLSVAALTGVLAFLGLLKTSVPEAIIITLLVLLAVDTLAERMSILESIDATVHRLITPDRLEDRSERSQIEDLGREAREIAAAGVTLVSLVTPRYDFFLEKLRDGCKLRFLVLDPSSTAMDAWMQGQRIVTPGDSDATLRMLSGLMSEEGVNGRCQVKLSHVHLPFSLVIVDPTRETGRLIVELLARKVSLPLRPSLEFQNRTNQRWFKFFVKQFEDLWDEAKVYNGMSSLKPEAANGPRGKGPAF